MTTKADLAAADRVLKAAFTKARARLADAADPGDVLADNARTFLVAGSAYELLVGEAS